MATRTLTAMFKTRGEAERAEQTLTSQLGLNSSTIQTSPGTGVTDAGYVPARPYEEKALFASRKSQMLPEEDRYAYAEGMRRGAVLLSAKVDDSQIDRASDILEHAGAMDLDAQETEWRKSGWTGYDASAHGSMRDDQGRRGKAGGWQARRRRRPRAGPLLCRRDAGRGKRELASGAGHG